MENAATEHVDNIVPGSRLLTEPDALSLGATFIFSRNFRHGKVDFDAMCPVNRGAVFCFFVDSHNEGRKTCASEPRRERVTLELSLAIA